mmetsp:Transcript_35526/g.82941  ORF Transcript_35526/g.82941 Transcript_35526/m.82941 type:complete len:272 (+) Transcript_35526:881-1696(+)
MDPFQSSKDSLEQWSGRSFCHPTQMKHLVQQVATQCQVKNTGESNLLRLYFPENSTEADDVVTPQLGESSNLSLNGLQVRGVMHLLHCHIVACRCPHLIHRSIRSLSNGTITVMRHRKGCIKVRPETTTCTEHVNKAVGCATVHADKPAFSGGRQSCHRGTADTRARRWRNDRYQRHVGMGATFNWTPAHFRHQKAFNHGHWLLRGVFYDQGQTIYVASQRRLLPTLREVHHRHKSLCHGCEPSSVDCCRFQRSGILPMAAVEPKDRARGG